jgi:iron complex transport system substrate-binding protein
MADSMPLRIVSLLPSATEIVCALGAGDELVGVSHECDHPPEVAALPALTCSRLEVAGTSGRIDRSVRDLVWAALAIYDLDVDRLASLDPDLVVTQDLCQVCAVAYDAVCAAVALLAGRDVRVVSLHPRRLGDIWDDIRRTAAAVGREAAGETLLGELRERLARVERRVAGAGRPGVVSGEQAPTLDRAALGALAPEVVVVKPCGYPVERTLAELDLLPKALPWEAGPRCRPAGCRWPTATPTSTAAARGSWTRPSCWPPACTPTGSRTRLGRDGEAVRRVDAGLEVHPALP